MSVRTFLSDYTQKKVLLKIFFWNIYSCGNLQPVVCLKNLRRAQEETPSWKIPPSGPDGKEESR